MTRSRAVKIISFLAVFFVCLTGLTYMLRTNGSVKDRFMGFYAEKKDTIDAVIIGSSPVFPYYAAPEIYGETGAVIYPLSTNLQRPAAQLYLAKEALSRQHPQLMIFEVRMYTGDEHNMTNNMAYTRGVTDNLKYSKNRLDAILALTDESSVNGGISDSDKEACTYIIDIFKYHSNWRSLRDPGQWTSFLFTKKDPHKGYTSSNELGPCELVDYSWDEDRTPIPEIQDGHLTELMDWLEENGQQALFIVSPFLESEEQHEMFNYIGDRVTAEGFGFLDLNDYVDECGLDGATDFNDYGNHVNALGSGKVTRFFENYLEEHYDLPDRRGDNTYRSWDEAYSLWQQESESDIETVKQHIKDKTYAEIAE